MRHAVPIAGRIGRIPRQSGGTGATFMLLM
jgi:hypothetical protein